MNEEVSPKRSPKRRGPTKRYAPETTDVSPVKKAHRKAVPKRGAKVTTPASTTITAIPEVEIPMATTPYSGMSEMDKALFFFQNSHAKVQEEISKQNLVIDQQQKLIETLVLEKKGLMERLAEKSAAQDPFAAFRRDTLDRMISLVHNFELQTQKRGTEIVHDAISAAGGLGTGAQAQPTFPLRQMEQMAHCSYHQNPQQASESFRGTKDVLVSMPGGLQRRVSMPVSSLNAHQSVSQPLLTPP